MLFNPDQSSPEASEDIALWLADEFSQVSLVSCRPTGCQTELRDSVKTT